MYPNKTLNWLRELVKGIDQQDYRSLKQIELLEDLKVLFEDLDRMILKGHLPNEWNPNFIREEIS